MPPPLSDFISRTPFAWLRERDIDLLFCSELHAKGELTRLLASKIAPKSAEFVGAWVSHAEADGETDLIANFSVGDKHSIALIENKIDAAFQPEQAQRYSARGQRWSTTSGISRVVTVLFAPSDYMRRPGAEVFQERITYEEAAVALRAENDPRSIFLADALVAGVESYRQGYVLKPDESVSDMWMACWSTALKIAPNLRFQQPTLKPGRATWFYFRDADGFSKEDRKRAVVVFKAERGEVDLQFAGTTAAALSRRVSSILDRSMKVVPAAKSASIRVSVPQIDFRSTAVTQEAAIIEGVAACERLRTFFIEHRERLLAG